MRELRVSDQQKGVSGEEDTMPYMQIQDGHYAFVRPQDHNGRDRDFVGCVEGEPDEATAEALGKTYYKTWHAKYLDMPEEDWDNLHKSVQESWVQSACDIYRAFQKDLAQQAKTQQDHETVEGRVL
jgi:hypothetical protein